MGFNFWLLSRLRGEQRANKVSPSMTQCRAWPRPLTRLLAHPHAATAQPWAQKTQLICGLPATFCGPANGCRFESRRLLGLDARGAAAAVARSGVVRRRSPPLGPLVLKFPRRHDNIRLRSLTWPARTLECGFTRSRIPRSQVWSPVSGLGLSHVPAACCIGAGLGQQLEGLRSIFAFETIYAYKRRLVALVVSGFRHQPKPLSLLVPSFDKHRRPGVDSLHFHFNTLSFFPPDVTA
ncbi:hypothetical protein TOPH_06974 [Tolypocladium ophioglossoides CBS 100239]|uniref:Uncharacterized protein n=1 Tax=Tolypocladium ophioglossoides (strain CBS 100239) TaxID=1163406 RepID=A0A0L0N3E1_TOLOC|nr:hypothetical protein TOPH_06974 [Tolypocladium ophioglossoides CBS 100239]